jgi:hypothetical protein
MGKEARGEEARAQILLLWPSLSLSLPCAGGAARGPGGGAKEWARQWGGSAKERARRCDAGAEAARWGGGSEVGVTMAGSRAGVTALTCACRTRIHVGEEMKPAPTPWFALLGPPRGRPAGPPRSSSSQHPVHRRRPPSPTTQEHEHDVPVHHWRRLCFFPPRKCSGDRWERGTWWGRERDRGASQSLQIWRTRGVVGKCRGVSRPPLQLKKRDPSPRGEDPGHQCGWSYNVKSDKEHPVETCRDKLGW